MVRIPTFTRRSDAAAARDEADERAATGRASVETTNTEAEAAPAPRHAAEEADRRDQVDDRAVYRSRAATAADAVAAEQAARQAGAERVATERAEERTETRTEADTAAERRAQARRAEERAAEATEVREPAKRARTSMMATLGLALSVVAALGVLSGRLAAYGLAVGVVALLLCLGGMAATRRRHVAGKGDGMLGLLLSLGSVVLGILVLTGALPWLTTGTDSVGQARDWLDARWNQYF